MLDPRRLEVLRAVAEHGSFSAAAEALSFTQPAISKQIAALEQELGVVLLHRTTRAMMLTEQGEHYRRDMQRVLNAKSRMLLLVRLVPLALMRLMVVNCTQRMQY